MGSGSRRTAAGALHGWSAYGVRDIPHWGCSRNRPSEIDDIKALSGMPAVAGGTSSARSPQAWGEPERVAGLVRSGQPRPVARYKRNSTAPTGRIMRYETATGLHEQYQSFHGNEEN